MSTGCVESFRWPESSSHYSKWLFKSLDELNSRRSAVYQEARSRLSDAIEPDSIPSLEDEIWLTRYFSHQLYKFLSTTNLKETVKETALTFFNRFYLRKSLLEYDPRVVMFTCITLAVKLEDMWRTVHISKLFGSVRDLDIAKVFQMESIVCYVLEFNFHVFHTVDSLYAVKGQCVEYLKSSLDIDDEILGEHGNLILSIYKQSELDCVRMHESPELMFLYTPSQLALSRFVHYCRGQLKAVMSVERFLTTLASTDKLHSLLTLLDKIHIAYEDHLKAGKALDSLEEQADSTKVTL